MDTKDFIQEPTEQEIDLMLKYLPPYSSENAENIKKKFHHKVQKRQKKGTYKMLAAAACASLVFISTLAYAAGFDITVIYNLLFGEKAEYIAPYIEPLSNITETTLDPAQASPSAQTLEMEHDGIIVKLISAINDENLLNIFLTATDTTGDRLGESLDFTTWGLSQGYGGGVTLIDYDNITKTAALMITSLGDDHQGQATLTINGFSSGREFLEDLPEPRIDVREILASHLPTIVPKAEYFIWGVAPDSHDQQLLLKPGEMDIPFDNGDMFSLSNAGFVDGALHLQVRCALKGAAIMDGHYVNVKFLNSAGEVVYNSGEKLDFIEDKKYAYADQRQEPHDEFSEFVFDGVTDLDQLTGLSLAMDYMKSPEIIEGAWEFSFMVPEKATTDFHINKTVPINGEEIHIEMVSLSPFGVTVHLSQNMGRVYNHSDQVAVTYTDGTSIELDHSAIHTYENESTLIFSGEIIDFGKVESLLINGERLHLAQ